MAIHVVNEKDVEKAKSGRGYTKWLHVSQGGSGPEMMIRHWGPDTDIPVHSHPYHEMFYVLEGEIEIGGTTIQRRLVHLYREKHALRSDARAERRESAALCRGGRSENSMDAYIDADGLKTFYVKAGSGFPVVLFHGAAPGASAQVNWQLNIEPLAAAGFTVYAYDQAGIRPHGKSSRSFHRVSRNPCQGVHRRPETRSLSRRRQFGRRIHRRAPGAGRFSSR